MKRILITGKGGFIGTAIETYLSRFPEAYAVSRVPLKTETPDAYDFQGADAIIHTAALVHRKETKHTQAQYDAVNRDLTAALAKKAKREGVKQFILMSTMSVYGMRTGTITKDTVPQPKTQYGRSKLEAEQSIAPLDCDTFRVTILRPPMVFGPGAKGNPARLKRLSRLLPVCPDFENRRTAVSVDTLCEEVKALIDEPRSGIFFPQEKTPLSTGELIARAMMEQGRTPRHSRILNPAIRVLRAGTGIGKKAFGDLVYEDLYELPLPDSDREETEN